MPDDVVAAVRKVAERVRAPPRPGTRRDVRTPVVGRVEGASADHDEGVARVGVDGDPLAGAGLTVGLEPSRILGRGQQAGAMEHVAGRARAVVAARLPLAVTTTDAV